MTARPIRRGALALLVLVTLWSGAAAWARTADDYMRDASDAFARGNYRAAEREYRRALEADPRHAYARVGLACTLLEMNQLDEAEQVLRQLMSMSPGFAPAYYMQGRLYEAKGQSEQARAAFQQYVTRSRGNIPPDPAIRLKLRKYGVL